MSRQMKTSLSQGLLSMKFMQKSKEKIEKEKEAQESRNLYASEITAEMKKDIIFITESSRGACEEAVKGRFSFGGINPEIERIMAEEEAEIAAQNEKKLETSISDESMATQLGKNIAKRFDKKQHKAHKKDHQNRHHPYKTFLKPPDN